MVTLVEHEALLSLLGDLDVGALDLRLLTRFSEADFLYGLSDIKALIHFVNIGGRLRVYPKNLHAKGYLADETAFCSSCTVSKGGLDMNIEALHDVATAQFTAWFETLWDAPASRSVELEELRHVAESLSRHPARTQITSSHQGLKDLAIGSDADDDSPSA
jgi:hypothetical protein